MNDFSIKLEIRIDWSEIDFFGHVNNVAILKYVQSVRVNYLENIGLMQSQAETKIGPIFASTSCQFHKPLYYPGQITIYSNVDYIKNTSLNIDCTTININRFGVDIGGRAGNVGYIGSGTSRSPIASNRFRSVIIMPGGINRTTANINGRKR